MLKHTTGREDPKPLTREDAVYTAQCDLLRGAMNYERDRTAILDDMMERDGWYERMQSVMSMVLQPQYYSATYIYAELLMMCEEAAERVADGRVPQGDDE